MSATKILWGQVFIVFAIVLATMWIATEWTAWRLGFQPELGRPWFDVLRFPIYLPPAFFWWWFADLVSDTRPATLYLVVPPSDISRTKPLIRLVLNQIGRRLTEELHPKNRRQRMLLMLDEFPALGRLDFFESALAFMAGYGLKSFLIAQSLNQIEKAYGANNAILDNCHVRVTAVMQAESGGDARAVSSKGAMGLMQIMPETWATLRLRYGLGADPFDPHDNIIAGAAYLRELHDRYGSPGFLAAYNAGPARYESHVATGQPLPAETRAYVALLAPMVSDGVISDAAVLPVAARSWTEAPLFTVRADDHTAADQPAAEQHTHHHATDTGAQDLTALAPQSDGLFVPRARRNPRP